MVLRPVGGWASNGVGPGGVGWLSLQGSGVKARAKVCEAPQSDWGFICLLTPVVGKPPGFKVVDFHLNPPGKLLRAYDVGARLKFNLISLL